MFTHQQQSASTGDEKTLTVLTARANEKFAAEEL